MYYKPCRASRLLYIAPGLILTRKTMYEQRYIVARSRNHYHHDNSTVLSLLFAGGVDLGATSTNVYSVAISELFLHCL